MAKKPMNAGEWFWRGDQFLSASALLWKHSKDTGQHLSLPEVSSKAFAAECYLKCLLRLRGLSAMEGEHNLKELYLALPLEDQLVIQCNWDPVMLQTLANTKKNMPPQFKMFAVPTSLREALKQNGNAFTEWRYRDKRPFVTWFLGPIARLVREHIVQVVPEWETSPPDISYSPDAEL